MLRPLAASKFVRRFLLVRHATALAIPCMDSEPITRLTAFDFLLCHQNVSKI